MTLTRIELESINLIELLDIAWSTQWRINRYHVFENQTCSHGCTKDVESLADQTFHHPDCFFVKLWNDLASVRKCVNDVREPEVRP